MTFARRIWHAPRSAATGLIRFYQLAISPMLGPTCRFQPTCSAYAIESLKKYGMVRGSLKTAWRIVRCNPFNPGGEDLP